ncbi:right-handed parallel beta-helix repeat-containing protein [Bacillus safensis]|uniref:right-handed parallel beta-helix repeat-containing protein n=1 Tax=Bacillus safensis TaxID=561879 RepID=UPI002FFFFD4D
MPKYIYKNFRTTGFDRKFIADLNVNFHEVSDDLLALDRSLASHKIDSKAHSSDQITHGVFTVANRLDNYGARFANLVVNHDGEDVKEVVDLRVALDASTHLTAKDRFDYDFAIIDQKISDAAVYVSLQPFLKKHGNFTDAMQAALNISKTKAATIYIPPGTYTSQRTLRIYRNTRLLVSEGVYIKRGFVGSMFVNGDSTDNSTLYNGHGNIVIEGGGTIDSLGAEFKEQCSVFSFGHADGVLIRDITILDVCGGHAFDCAGNQNVVIENVKFKGYADYVGDRWFSAAIQVDLMRDSSNFGAFGSYDHTPTRNITVRNCFFGKSTKLGGWARAIDSHTSTDGYLYSGITFQGNTVEDTAEWAVSGNKWQDVHITGNYFRNCAGGVRILLPDPNSVYTNDKNGNPTGRVNKTKRHIITGNSFDNITVDHAIQVYGRRGYQTIDDVVISSNTISRVTERHGIHVSDVTNFSISSNVLDDVNHHGILVTRSKYGSVSGNVARTIDGNGVRVEEDGCLNVSIADNVLKDIGFSGISVSGDSSRIIVNRNIIDNAGLRTNSTEGYDGIIFMDGVKRSTIVGNDITGKTMRYGMYLTSLCSDLMHYGNWLKGSGAVASLNDNSINPVTNAADVV